MKRLLTAALALILLSSCLLCGCSLFEASPKTFSKAGMSITLTDRFSEKEYVSFTSVYDSQYVAVFVLKEEFSLLEDAGLSVGRNSTAEAYANLIIQLNNLNVAPEEKDGFLTYTYQKDVNGDNYTYYAFVFKSEDAFWTFQFTTKTDQFEDQESNILTYAKSISFS